MAKHIVETMLPEHDAKIHQLSLHERKWLQLEMCIYDIFCIFCMSNLSFSAMDGDQLVDFYWIDPMLTAERIAAKSKYAGHMHYQFELEESWDRPGVRAFTPLWACLLSLWTGVVSVFTASFDQIRCTCTIYASHAKYV